MLQFLMSPSLAAPGPQNPHSPLTPRNPSPTAVRTAPVPISRAGLPASHAFDPPFASTASTVDGTDASSGSLDGPTDWPPFASPTRRPSLAPLPTASKLLAATSTAEPDPDAYHRQIMRSRAASIPNILHLDTYSTSATRGLLSPTLELPPAAPEAPAWTTAPLLSSPSPSWSHSFGLPRPPAHHRSMSMHTPARFAPALPPLAPTPRNSVAGPADESASRDVYERVLSSLNADDDDEDTAASAADDPALSPQAARLRFERARSHSISLHPVAPLPARVDMTSLWHTPPPPPADTYAGNPLAGYTLGARRYSLLPEAGFTPAFTADPYVPCPTFAPPPYPLYRRHSVAVPLPPDTIDVNRQLNLADSLLSHPALRTTTQPPATSPVGSGLASSPSFAATSPADGVPAGRLPADARLITLLFKAGRSDIFYLTSDGPDLRPGTHVICEGDRGVDLGEVGQTDVCLDELRHAERLVYAQTTPTARKPAEVEVELMRASNPRLYCVYRAVHCAYTSASSSKEVLVKRVHRPAAPGDLARLPAQRTDEARALEACRTKVAERLLPMRILDAEFQWDRQKLIFTYRTERRVDFRDLVRDLYKTFKTRIWLKEDTGSYYATR
ncbi:hypothetical protein IWQ60_002947 [Tieghemiomyces parasiticus]|uniref:PSP1 C-terminal domain-containing protein n=1 Tax=Tieghemiomyces parasiticus TaxID=78921 RepID=A0A9W8AB87_9FUNG|nr:hypothetical protein IWQ60_002947 [Tieghemiomyces parasiticus]